MAKPAKIKTTENDVPVEDFINTIADEQKRKDSFSIVKMMEKVTKEKPKMWGTAIIGFGNKRYKSPTSGREVDWFKIGFSPRKANFSLYLTTNITEHSADLPKLGKYKTGGGCLYINKLADVDIKVLEHLFKEAMKNK
jgi:hypothetical protein